MSAAASPRGWGLILATGIGIGITAIDATAINVALADIQRDLDTNVSSLQLIVNAFTLALVVVVVTVGRLGDMLGRRRVYLWGFVGYAVASVICAVAPSDVVLIVGRLAMGATGAILFSLSLALLRASFSEERFHWAIGYYATVAALGLSLGPLIGGGLVDLFSWRALFWVNVPLTAVGLALGLRFIEESSDAGASRRIDVPGVITLGVGLGAVVLGVIQSSEWGWGSAATIGCLAGGSAVLVVFVLVERAVKSPVVELDLFRNPPFTGSAVVCAVLFWVVFAFLFLFGLYFQNVEGDSAFVAGLRMLPYAVVFMLTAGQVPAAIKRFGQRATLVGSLAITTAGVFGLSYVDPDTPAWLTAVLVAMIGLGNAGTIVPASAAGVGAVPAEKSGLAAGILVMTRYLGAVLGVAVAGEILDAGDTFIDGMSVAMRISAAVGVAGIVVAALTLRGEAGERRPGALARLVHLHHGHTPHG